MIRRSLQTLDPYLCPYVFLLLFYFRNQTQFFKNASKGEAYKYEAYMLRLCNHNKPPLKDDDPTENELMAAERSIENTSKKLSQLKPRKVSLTPCYTNMFLSVCIIVYFPQKSSNSQIPKSTITLTPAP